MANPFITQASQMQTQNLIDPESLALQRQKQYAAALLQQNQQPQGQMVSGHFVAPSFTEKLNSALTPLVGAYMLNQADTKQTQLAEALREQGDKDLMAYGQAVKGAPEQTVYGAGMEGPTMDVTPAVAPDYSKGMSILRRSKDPENRQLAKMLMVDQLKTQKVGEGESLVRQNPDGTYVTVGQGAPKYRAPIQVDTGNAIEFRDPTDPTKVLQTVKKSMSMKDMAELADKGIIVGGGQPSGGMPTVGSQGNVQSGGQKVTGDARYMPATLPTYEYDPNLSPAQNREAQGEFSKGLTKNVKLAKDTFQLLKSASGLLNSNAPSSGLIENAITGTREIFGGGGETSKADQRLRMIGGALTMSMPRFEGPQGVLDVKLYEKLAGDLGNANLPIATRNAAIDQMIELQKKYYPNGDWASIDTGGAVKIKNILGGTRGFGGKVLQPEEFAKGLNPADQEAFKFVRENPNHPRAAEIKKRLRID